MSGSFIPLEDRLVRRTKKCANGCIEWQGSKSSFGYGKIGLPGGKQLVNTHRLAYEVFIGPIPDGLWVLHRCDNPACLNPVHLFLGTHLDNMRDMRRKKRGHREGHTWGEDHPKSKLTEAKVREMRRRHASGETVNSIAADMGVTSTTVRGICQRKWWKHVS